MSITVKLTARQAMSLYNILSWDEGWVQNNDYPKSDPYNAYWERIRVKIGKQLAPNYFGGKNGE